MIARLSKRMASFFVRNKVIKNEDDFEKCVCNLFLSAKRAYCSAKRYPRKGEEK